jgi:hypothetical protein
MNIYQVIALIWLVLMIEQLSFGHWLHTALDGLMVVSFFYLAYRRSLANQEGPPTRRAHHQHPPASD